MSLSMRGIAFSYGRSEILDEVGFEAADSRILTILGPNGSGKTTLLKCVNRILEPASGTIVYDGKDMRRLPLKRLAEYMSYVPQNHGTAFPITVIDTVLMGRIPHSESKIRGADKDAAFGALEIMDEPTSNLDVRNQLETLGLIRRIV